MSDLTNEMFLEDQTSITTPYEATPWIGYVAIIVSATFFGSNFLPVKKFQTGNGLFFQWVLCAGIWTTGLVTLAVRNFPQYYPLAMAGGFVWCTGNLMCVPAINLIGLAKGILLWGSFNLMMGWASSRYGWFGLKAQEPGIIWLNYLGVVLCLLSALMYLLTKTSGNDTMEEAYQDGFDLDQVDPMPVEKGESNGKFQKLKVRISKNKLAVKSIGSLMACLAGCFFGLTFTPIIYIKDYYIEASDNGLDHVFAHFTGIFIASTFYFLVYCALSKNSPTIYPKVALPGYLSGLMWGVACIGWFIANDALSEAVSYPIVTTLPGIIGTFWGLLFREIKGLKNYIVLFLAISIGVAGTVVTGLSK